MRYHTCLQIVHKDGGVAATSQYLLVIRRELDREQAEAMGVWTHRERDMVGILNGQIVNAHL